MTMLIIESKKYLVPVFSAFHKRELAFIGWWSELSNVFIPGIEEALNKVIKYGSENYFSFRLLIVHIPEKKRNGVYDITIYCSNFIAECFMNKRILYKRILH